MTTLFWDFFFFKGKSLILDFFISWVHFGWRSPLERCLHYHTHTPSLSHTEIFVFFLLMNLFLLCFLSISSVEILFFSSIIIRTRKKGKLFPLSPNKKSHFSFIFAFFALNFDKARWIATLFLINRGWNFLKSPHASLKDNFLHRKLIHPPRAAVAW